MQFKEPSGITVDKYRGFVGRGKAGAVAGVTDGISQQCGWADGRMGGLSKYGTSSKVGLGVGTFKPPNCRDFQVRDFLGNLHWAHGRAFVCS